MQKAANKVGVSRKRVQCSKVVVKKDKKKLAEEVKSEKISLRDAEKEIRKKNLMRSIKNA
ncbi:MAG TPA: hypothetical protein VLA72_14760 [Anaerolineales bacterium]|nr:hypothetical protein [Anaerolineales bacterium]